jgi:hypothetical protein
MALSDCTSLLRTGELHPIHILPIEPLLCASLDPHHPGHGKLRLSGLSGSVIAQPAVRKQGHWANRQKEAVKHK